MQKQNNITAIYPNQKRWLKIFTDWIAKKRNEFLSTKWKVSFREKEMPLTKSVNNIADFVLNRETHEAIELIQKINTEVNNRFSANSDKFLKESQDLKNYLKTKIK